MNDDQERSGSGEPIYRYKPRESEWQTPENPGLFLEEIQDHLAQHIGEVDNVFHEIVSDLVHLDVLVVPANDERPFHLLVTSGVSDLPMMVPEGMEEYNRCELMIALPPDWPLDEMAFKEESNYWPVRWLKMLGRLPHEYKTWIGWGHTIPNGDPPEPIADTQFSGFMLAPPYFFPPEFFRLTAKSGDIITFYMVVPLYSEEMELKLNRGADALEDLFGQHDIDFVVDPGRPNVALGFE